MAKTAQAFIDEYKGKKDDYDGVYGEQCVDAYKRFCKWLGVPVLATKTGWADGYWYHRIDYSAHVTYITDPKKLKKGDWLFWARGSSCPSSHVAMFVSYAGSGYAYCFGQNQGGNGGYTTVKLKLDILGAFRFKALQNETPNWIKDNRGWWYKHADGSYTTHGWEKIKGKWYYFGSDGYMLTGWIAYKDGWYYCDEDGAMVTNWRKINNKWYFFDTNGKMVTGWISWKGKWYYCDDSGAMVTGKKTVPAYFDENGALRR